MIKLIIADMDGTLLNDNHEIHPDFWKVEEALHEKDIKFAIASGRQYFNLEEKFERIKDRMLFFAENGTHVVHMGKELFVDPLDPEAARKFIHLGRKMPDVQLVLCGKTSAYIEHDDPAFISEIKNYYTKVELVEDLTAVQDTILKVTLCDWRGVEEYCYPAFKEYEVDFKVAMGAEIFLDITAKTANKGNAIKGVQNKMGISPEETLVFGDYLNDLEMMQNASYSYAMKNAHPEIIKASKYITKFDNNRNGVLKTIWELGLIPQEETSTIN